MSLAIFMPLALFASQPVGEARHSDINTDDYHYNQTSELLTLDDVALQELANMGFDLSDPSDELASHIIDYATQYLGKPYRHGAKGPYAFDCSGFTSFIFKEYGIELSASSRTQFTQGEKISFDEIKPGDLLFFGGRAGGKTVGHVALAVEVNDNGTVTFIHAANKGGIRYDTYPDGGYYSRRYLGARRVIE